MEAGLPNVVFIVLDSVRRDHVSAYGHTRDTTPTMDRIAREGVRYTRASAVTCWTIPSHASLFTGLYPSQHRADFDTRHLDDGHETLAEVLGRAGYRSASFSCNGFVADHTNLTRGFDLAVDVEKGALGESRVGRSLGKRLKKLTAKDRGAQKATTLATEWMEEGADDRPFFLFLNYMDCHLPYALRHADRYRFVAEEDRGRAEAVPMDPFGAMAGAVDYTPDEIELLKAQYDGCLRYLDGHVGLIDDQLARLGLQEDTVLIITSDHGESFGEHGLHDHQYGLYEHLLGVPLIVRGPGFHRDTVDDLVQLIDLFPTLCAAAGSPRPDVPGRDLRSPEGPDLALAEYLVPNLRAIHRRFPESDTSRFDVAIRSIRSGDDKLIAFSDGRVELYHLGRDPEESDDRADLDVELVDALDQRMSQILGPWPEIAATTLGDDDSEELAERLKALGYL